MSKRVYLFTYVLEDDRLYLNSCVEDLGPMHIQFVAWMVSSANKCVLFTALLQSPYCNKVATLQNAADNELLTFHHISLQQQVHSIIEFVLRVSHAC